jgi:hypothetical protein
MKELVRLLAQQLANNPDAVEVTETRGDATTLLELRVAPEDLGTATTLPALLRSICSWFALSYSCCSTAS